MIEQAEERGNEGCWYVDGTEGCFGSKSIAFYLSGRLRSVFEA